MSVRTEPEEIHHASRAAPDRILGLFGINPMRRVCAAADAEVRARFDILLPPEH